MKKLLIRILMSAALLVLLNWVYSKWFFEKDLRTHSDIVEMSWQVVDDSCRIIYLGASSNNHYGDEELNRRKISDFTSDYFPTVQLGDLTKEASHAQTHYYLLKHIPKKSAVETVVVTMNLRTFDAGWIYSSLETALRKQLVLLEDYPPLVNRFLLAFKAYPIKSKEEWDALVMHHWKTDPLNFPYSFEWNNAHEWDSAMAWRGWHDFNGDYDPELTALACHYIKTYAFTITDENPRVKDFDDIVKLCHERGWKLVFNLMAENVDKANELVGKDLMFLTKRNRDYLLNRYGHLDDVTIVDNLSLVRDVNFIDQNWTTEHYYEEGRRIIAEHLAQTLKVFYPEDYQCPDSLRFDTGHYYFGEEEQSLGAGQPFSHTLTLPVDSIHKDWGMVNIAFEVLQSDTLHQTNLAVEIDDFQGNTTTEYYPIMSQIKSVGQWDFATFALPLDSLFQEARQMKIFLYNPSDHVILTRNLDVSFRPAYLKSRVKGQTYKSADAQDGE